MIGETSTSLHLRASTALQPNFNHPPRRLRSRTHWTENPMKALVRYLLGALGAAAALGLWLLMHSSSASAITPDSGAGCTRYWMGWTSTDWHTTSNWSSVDGGFGGAALPGPGDVVCMATAPVRADVSLTGAAVTVGGIQFGATGTVSPTLTISSSGLAVNGTGGAINSLTLTQASLSGSAAVQLTGNSQNTGFGTAYIYGSGTKTVVNGATWTVSGDGLVVGSSGCLDPAMLTVAGTITVNSPFDLCTATDASSAASVTLNGTMQIGSSTFAEVGGFAGHALPPTLVNNGDIVVGGLGQDSYISGILFANRGFVDINQGALLLQNSANPPSLPDTGLYRAGTGGVVVERGQREFAGGSVTGTLSGLDGASLTFDNSYSATSLVLSSSSATCATSLTVGRLQTSRWSDTAAASQIGCDLSVTDSATIEGLELLPFADLTLDGEDLINPDGGDIIMDSNARIDSYGHVYVDGPGSNALRTAAPLTTTVAIYPGSTFEVDGPFIMAPDYLYMDGSYTLGYSAALTLGGSGSYGDFESSGSWLVGPSTSLVVDASVDFRGGSVSGSGTVTQARGSAFDFESPISFPSLISSGELMGSASIGTFTSRNAFVTGAGTLTLTGSSSITGLIVIDGAVVSNAGRMTVHRSRAIQLLTGGQLVNSSSMTITGAGTAGITGDGTSGSGLVLNTGSTTTAMLASAAASFTVSAPITNSGTLRIHKGTVALTGAISNLDGGTLVGGIWWADGGTLALPTGLKGNDAVVTLAATPNSAITIAGTSSSALIGLTENSGTLAIAQPLTMTQSLTTKGLLTIAASVHMPGMSQTGGTVTLTGDLFSATPVSVTSGTFTGTGKLDGSLTNAGGSIAPGFNGIGTLSINGSFNQTSGFMKVTLGKSELDVSGNASLGGTLALRTPTPHPAIGTAVTPLVSVGTVSGHFAHVTGRTVSGTGTWNVTYLSNAVRCTLAT